MIRQRTIAVLLAVVLSLSMVATVPASSSTSVHDLDDDWQLTREDSIETFESSGSVTATDVGGHQFDVTISDSRSEVPLSGFHSDTLNTYLHVEYEEDIQREYRLYVPSEYFTPRVKQDLEAENADITIDLHRSSDSDYTVVRIQFDGPTDAVFKLGAGGAVYGIQDSISSYVNDTTGISPPSLGSSDPADEWSYVDASALGGENATTTISRYPDKDETPENADRSVDEIRIQYDASGPDADARWVNVRSCTRDPDPVCYWTVDEDDDTIYLKTTTSDPPQVRYKYGGDRVSGIMGDINELREGLSEFVSDIRESIGWG